MVTTLHGKHCTNMTTLPLIPHTLASRLAALRQRIALAEAQAQRPAGSVQLLAVSKTFAATAIAQALAAGQHAFGENYLQEAVEKISALADHPEVQWHCIGPVQSRKTALVARHFHWLHSLDRLDIAQRLSRQRSADAAPLHVCLQVNMDGGANKSGLPPGEALALALAVRELPHLQLRGLMSIPEPYADPRQTLAVHRQTKALFDQMGQQLALPAWDTLSMGMSADLEQAIAAGSTLVRVGSALFGPRA